MIQKLRHNVRKTRLFVLLMMTGWIFGAEAYGSPVDSLVQAANRHYMNLEYQEAAECYMLAIDEGYMSSALYYNLGNACYKLNQTGRAILYFEKARELAPFDEDIRNNLQMANALVVDKMEAIPDFFVKRWWRFMVDLLKPDAWAVISLLSFGIALFFVFMFITLPGMSRFRKHYLVMGTVMLVLALFCYVSGVSRKRSIFGNHHAIIMVPSVTIKSSPDELGTNVFVLHEGTRVEIMERLEDWREIRIANGSRGWLPESSIDEI